MVYHAASSQLHFSDPQAYSDIYNTTFIKNRSLYNCFGSGLSVFGLIDFQEAHKRRLALGNLFSRRAILRLEGEMQKHVRSSIPPF